MQQRVKLRKPTNQPARHPLDHVYYDDDDYEALIEEDFTASNEDSQSQKDYVTKQSRMGSIEHIRVEEPLFQ